MNKLEFCARFVYLDGAPIRFTGRDYLRAIYASTARTLVLRCSRQVEKSTFLANSILFEVCARPRTKILFVSPREEQARTFSSTRLMASLAQSSVILHRLLGRVARRPPLFDMEFRNGSRVHVRAAFHNADACRGLSADLLLIDEFQDVAHGVLPVLQETLSHSPYGRTILTGTPKSIENHLEQVFRQSKAHEWLTPCNNCEHQVLLDEHCLGTHGTICSKCRTPINVMTGRWVARNPHANSDGYSINHLQVPWIDFHEVLDRQRTYDVCRFKNEVLGLSTTAGEQVVTRAELEACCGEYSMATSLESVPRDGRSRLIAGIDWGAGGAARTVLTIGFMRSDYAFQVCRWERFAGTEDPSFVVREVAQRCADFGVALIAADGGGSGHVLNRLLLDRLGRGEGLYAILYSESDQKPRRDGILTKWTVDRTSSMGVLFTRIKKRQMIFPRSEESGTFLDEFACEVAEYDDHSRKVRYTHPPGQQDDALHSTNYAVLLATLLYAHEQQYYFPDDE